MTKLKWKPRDTGWFQPTKKEMVEIPEIVDVDYKKEFPYLNHKWPDGEKVEWFEENSIKLAVQRGHDPFVKVTGGSRRVIWCRNCKEEIDLKLKAYYRLPTSNSFGSTVSRIKKPYLMDTIAGDLLEKRCNSKLLSESCTE